MPRNIADDLVEALKLLKKGQTIAMLMYNEPGSSERLYNVLKRHIDECEAVLVKYPNLHKPVTMNAEQVNAVTANDNYDGIVPRFVITAGQVFDQEQQCFVNAAELLKLLEKEA
jgi:hypothetical protein